MKRSAQVVAEVKVLRERGSLPLDPNYFEEGESLDRLYSVGGVIYGMRWSDVPNTLESRVLIAYLRQSLSINVAMWFSARGLLSDGDLGSYVEKSYEAGRVR